MHIIISNHIISTDEDPGLRIESFAVINLRGVSTYNGIITIFYVLVLCTQVNMMFVMLL